VRIISSLGKQESSAAQVAHRICISAKIDVSHSKCALKLSFFVLFSFAWYMNLENRSLIACGYNRENNLPKAELGVMEP